MNQIVILSDPVKPKQGANFPIEPYIVLELQDADGQRIYSGRDSNLVKFCSQVITTVTINTSAMVVYV